MPSITVRRVDDLPYGPGQSDYEYDAYRIRRDEEQMTKQAEVVAVPQIATPTPMAMLQVAVEKGASVEQLERLMALQERWEANEAKKEFVAAMTQFKESPVIIEKNATVDFASAKGRTHYKHATLANVCDAIGPELSKVGISHRWETEQLENGMIRVTCVLTHARGHSEKVFLQAGRDESGNKNNIQAVGSTVTYLQRYTLLAATGMAVADQRDDDGAGGRGVHELDAGLKADYMKQVEALADKKHAEALWQTIAAECSKSGDVAAYEELKRAVAAKVRALNVAEKGII